MFEFEHAINCYIPARDYMPVGYGQLGCSGFIVSDGQGNFVSRKTSAFLQYGEHAFRDVESLLETLVGPLFGQSSAVANTTAVSPNNEFSPVPNIGIGSMDEEHARCDKALEAMLRRPTVESLRPVLKELQGHFAHEERLLMQYGFGGTLEDPFSALHSHAKDHKRILKLVESAIRQGASSCSIKRM